MESKSGTEKVTQRARQYAEKAYDHCGDPELSVEVAAGTLDDGYFVQAFARFEREVAQEAEQKAMERGPYLVWSNEHQAWWGRDRCGYTRIIANAGRYDRAEALKIAGTRDGGWHVRKGNPDEIAMTECDAIDQYASITAAQVALSPAPESTEKAS